MRRPTLMILRHLPKSQTKNGKCGQVHPFPFKSESHQQLSLSIGRAIYVIQETLPEFFDIGLVVSVNKATGMPSRSAPTANANFLESSFINDLEEPIYSPNIRMSYTPPAPFPKTFHLEGMHKLHTIFLSQQILGLQLYVGSSGIIRHMMNALYSDLTVRVAKLVIDSPPTLCSGTTGKRKINRDKSFRIRQIVVGNSRVSGKPSEWEMWVASSFPKCVSYDDAQRIHIHFLSDNWAHSPTYC
jgi:hypothetical protein